MAARSLQAWPPLACGFVLPISTLLSAPYMLLRGLRRSLDNANTDMSEQEIHRDDGQNLPKHLGP